MKNIVIKELKDNAYQYLIFSTTVDSPFFQIDEIIKAIKCSKKVENNQQKRYTIKIEK